MPSATETPTAALEMHSALISWWFSPIGRAYAKAFGSLLAEADRPNQIWVDPRYGLAEGRLAELEGSGLKQCPTYFVTEEMVDLVEHAAPSMPEQPLQVDDLPSYKGFAWLERPVYYVDRKRKRCNVRAFHWSLSHDSETGNSGVWLATYSDILDPGDDYHDDLARMSSAMFRLSFLNGQVWSCGVAHQVQETNLREEELQGMSASEFLGSHPRGPVVIETQFMAAFWTLLGQRVAQQSTERASRPIQRRAVRIGMTEPAEVKVITLRRPQAETTEGDHDNPTLYSHRWIVDGHWRNQWLPSRQCHRLTWIAPHVKGPDDKPLVVKKRVYNWAR